VTTIGELADAGVLAFGDGYRTKRSEHGAPGFRILRVGDVADGGAVSPTGPDFVSDRYANQIGPKAAEPGDVILTTKGTVGRVAVMPETPEPIVYSPQICYFRVTDSDVLDPRFLRYWFESEAFWRQASHRMNNTDMAAYINLADVRSLDLDLPGRSRQRAIADVLGALDDKIAANGHVLSAGSALADASVSKAIAAGAESVGLGSLVRFRNSERVPLSARERDARQGDVPYYGATGQFGTVDAALFDQRLVLVGEDGSVIDEERHPVVQYIWGPAWVNNHAHVLEGTRVSTELLELLLRRSDVSALVTGAVQPKLSMGNLKSLAIDVPAEPGLRELEDTVVRFSAIRRAVVDENRLLCTLRDALLPALMSGRLRVRDAQEAVDAAGGSS
jgi:type I restriction enzyme S subunit